MTHNTKNIHERYNPEHDVNPDPNAPKVTWAEKGLAEDVDAIAKMVGKHDETIATMQADIKRMPNVIKDDLLTKIEATQHDLQAAQVALFTISEELIKAKLILETRKAQAIASGQVTGKNAEEREANQRVMFQLEYREIEDAERNQRAARSRFDAASMYMDYIKTTVRILELPNA